MCNKKIHLTTWGAKQHLISLNKARKATTGCIYYCPHHDLDAYHISTKMRPDSIIKFKVR